MDQTQTFMPLRAGCHFNAPHSQRQSQNLRHEKKKRREHIHLVHNHPPFQESPEHQLPAVRASGPLVRASGPAWMAAAIGSPQQGPAQSKARPAVPPCLAHRPRGPRPTTSSAPSRSRARPESRAAEDDGGTKVSKTAQWTYKEYKKAFERRRRSVAGRTRRGQLSVSRTTKQHGWPVHQVS